MAALSIRVEGNNTTADAGDLSVGPSYTLSGRVVLSDGQAIPANSRLMIGREDAWDSQTVILDATGHFSVSGVPAERIHLSVAVRGYHLARENHSLDLLNLTRLLGTVNGDISGLTVLLEPGRVELSSPEQRTSAGEENASTAQGFADRGSSRDPGAMTFSDTRETFTLYPSQLRVVRPAHPMIV